jgi:hypothetical protein
LTDNNSQNSSNDFENDLNTESSETDPSGGGDEKGTNGPSLKEKISNFGLKHGKTINTVG